MRLSERIRVIERVLNLGPGSCVDVSIERIEHGDTTRPMFILFSNHLWTQHKGESYETYTERATAGALSVYKPSGPNSKLKLIAKHPKLTREKWNEKYSRITKG